MRALTRRGAVLGGGTACLVTAVVLWLDGPDQPAQSQAVPTTEPLAAAASFSISGDARGLIAPGVAVPLDLRFDNLSDVDLAVDQVSVTVTDVVAPRADDDHPCSVADFEVRQLAPNVVLRLAGNDADDLGGMGVARSSWPTVGLRDRRVNQDGCKGASWTLDYEAHGVEVER